MRIPVRAGLLLGSTALVSMIATDWSRAQTELPEVKVTAPKKAPKPAPKKTVERKPATRTVAAPRPAPTPAPPPPTPEQIAAQAAEHVIQQGRTFDQQRSFIYQPSGANSYEFTHQQIEDMPGGTNAPLDKVLLQAPGVTQDSAASGLLHVRNEHGNVAYRINGIILPDGVQGFGQVLESSFIGSMALLTGVMPAQYGLRTAAVVDIKTRVPNSPGTGSVGVYGGSHEQITPSLEYGGVVGNTEYFAVGRYWGNDMGIENTIPDRQAIHDNTAQGRAFGYASTLNDDSSRTTIMSGWWRAKFQIPNTPFQQTNFAVSNVGPNDPASNSALLNEYQDEMNVFGVIAWQKRIENWDVQVAYVNRYNSVHFNPDLLGDLVFNGVATNVFRGAFINGLQTDAAWRVNEAHTIRTGFVGNGELTNINDTASTLPVDATSGAQQPSPILGIIDPNSKLGWLAGIYLQDEWRLTDQLTVNYGARFDQMWQYVNTNQVSPRINFVYKPFGEWTTLHAGYARYFTPPNQSLAAPTNTLAFANTTAAPPGTFQDSPVLPERGDVWDVGIVQKLIPGMEIGVDTYYKIAHDLIDDGQFGQALVLTAFNYERGENYGVEVSGKWNVGNFNVYGNLAWAVQRATNIVSNQFLFSANDLAYISDHYVFTDHAQTYTASGGMSYLWLGTKYYADMIYGSGLRAGDLNLDHLPAYGQVNAGLSREIPMPGEKPITVRFDVLNVFDEIYQIRNGTGIGVFSSQFGPRRGYFVGISQKL
jgi:hypothetical protein